jgi:hypothetical protein
MKFRILIPALLAAVAIFTACNKPVKGTNGVTYKTPVQYNDYIVSRQTDLMRKVINFSKAAEVDIDSAANMLSGYATETGKMIEEIKGMPPYKGDSTLRNAAVRSFTFYKKVFEEDYMDIIRIRKKEDISQEDVDEMDRIVKKITKEEEGYDKSFHNAQNEFANKHNMRLKENEVQKEMDEELN